VGYGMRAQMRFRGRGFMEERLPVGRDAIIRTGKSRQVGLCAIIADSVKVVSSRTKESRPGPADRSTVKPSNVNVHSQVSHYKLY